LPSWKGGLVNNIITILLLLLYTALYPRVEAALVENSEKNASAWQKRAKKLRRLGEDVLGPRFQP
jgi:hypothetical protein